MDGLVHFIERSVCGYKGSSITLGSKFYWTESFLSSTIEVAPNIQTEPIEVAPNIQTEPSANPLGIRTEGVIMNWTRRTCRRSTSGTAPAVAALIAISALIAPAQAFAAPTPLTASGYAIGASKLFRQTNRTDIATTITAASNKPDKGDDDDDDYDYFYTY
jgi:hypothetical protein